MLYLGRSFQLPGVLYRTAWAAEQRLRTVVMTVGQFIDDLDAGRIDVPVHTKELVVNAIRVVACNPETDEVGRDLELDDELLGAVSMEILSVTGNDPVGEGEYYGTQYAGRSYEEYLNDLLCGAERGLEAAAFLDQFETKPLE